jgi:hypothetical protein
MRISAEFLITGPENGCFHQFDALFHQLATVTMMAIPIAVSASHHDHAA